MNMIQQEWDQMQQVSWFEGMTLGNIISYKEKQDGSVQKRIWSGSADEVRKDIPVFCNHYKINPELITQQ